MKLVFVLRYNVNYSEKLQIDVKEITNRNPSKKKCFKRKIRATKNSNK